MTTRASSIPNCSHKYTVGCLQLSSSICCWCIQQYSNTPRGRLLLSINDTCRPTYPAADARFCCKCLKYWTFHGVPAQNASSTPLGSLEHLSGIPSPAPNLLTVPPSSTHPRRPHQRKSRQETIDTLRAELQAIRDGISRILANLQTLNDTLPVHQPTSHNTQRHNVSSTRRRMDEMDTSPIDSVADDQDSTAMTGNGFDRAIQEDTAQSSGFGFADEAAPQRLPLHNAPTDPMAFQYGNANPAIPNYSFPQPPNTFGPPVPFVNPWPQGFPMGQPVMSPYAPNMGVHPQALPSSIVMHPSGYSMMPPHPGAPQVSNATPSNVDRSTDQWRPYSTLTLRNPVNQRDRATLEAPRRPYNHSQRRGRRQHSRSGPPTKRLDDMNDGRPEAKESSELSVKLECKICMTQLIDTVVFPCGHAALCRWCADLHILPDRSDPRKPANCPVCRVPVERKDRLFFS